MKKETLVTYLGLVVALTACQDGLDPQLDSSEFSMEWAGAFEQVLDRHDDAQLPFQFEVTDIQESRCPSSVQCIRLGEVIVSTELRSPGMTNASHHDFCLGDCPQQGGFDTLEISIDGLDYRFVLKDVVPYPVTPDVSDLQTAIFQVERL